MVFLGVLKKIKIKNKINENKKINKIKEGIHKMLIILAQ